MLCVALGINNQLHVYVYVCICIYIRSAQGAPGPCGVFILVHLQLE